MSCESISAAATKVGDGTALKNFTVAYKAMRSTNRTIPFNVVLLLVLFMAKFCHSDTNLRLPNFLPSYHRLAAINPDDDQQLPVDEDEAVVANAGRLFADDDEQPKQMHNIKQQNVLPERPCYFSPIQCLLRTPGLHEVFENHPKFNVFSTDLQRPTIDQSVIGASRQHQHVRRHLLGPMNGKNLMVTPSSSARHKLQASEIGRRQRLFGGNPWKLGL
uniref:Uncharacterized protein n=1 Tax=Globodera rostochiensis TaxID=31243 RepID=A0A914I3V3_GLORO